MGRHILFSGNPGANMSNSATQFNFVRQARPNTWDTTIGNRTQLVSADCKIFGLTVMLSGAPGAGNQYTFTLMRNGSATALNFRIAGTGTQASSFVTISLSAGDNISLRQVPTSTPTARTATWSWITDEVLEDGGNVIISGTSEDLPTLVSAGDSFQKVAGGYLWAVGAFPSGSVGRFSVVPVDCTVHKLNVEITAAPGSSNTRTFTVADGNGATSLACTVATGGTSCTDDTSVALAAGDRIRFGEDRSGDVAAADAQWGVQIDLGNEENSIALGTTSNTLSTTETRYNFINASGHLWNSALARRESPSPLSGRIVAMYVILGVPVIPDSGSWEFTLFKNGSATPVTVSIDDGDASGNITSEVVEINPFDLLALEVDPIGSVNSNLEAGWGFLFETRDHELMKVGVGI